MKKLAILSIAFVVVLLTGCKKELDVEGPGLASGPVKITLTTPTAGEVISSNTYYSFTGTLEAPKGIREAFLVVFGEKYPISVSNNVYEYAVSVLIPENIATGQSYDFQVYASDFDDNELTETGTFVVSQGLNAVIIAPIAGITDAILAGLTGTFIMRLNYETAPTSIILKIKYDEANIQEEVLDLTDPDQFYFDTEAGKNSYIAQKNVTIPSDADAGVYAYWFEVMTPEETLNVEKKVEISKISQLWVLGDATSAGWDIDNPIQMNNTGANKFGKSLPLFGGAGQGFKFVLEKSSWDVNWGTFESSPIALNTDYPLNPGGNNIMVADTGNYILSVDFSTNMFKITEFQAPDSLFLVGGSTPAGWDPNAALPFREADDGIFEIFSPITTDGFGFKFLPNKGSWDGDWGMKPGEPGVLAQDGEENCTVAEDGFYKVVVDFNTMTYTATKTDWGIIGSAIPPYNWSVDVDMTYVGGAEPFTWEITGYTVVDGEFKYRANDGWTINMGGNSGNLWQDGPNIPVAAGTYTFRMTLAPTGYTYEIIP